MDNQIRKEVLTERQIRLTEEDLRSLLKIDDKGLPYILRDGPWLIFTWKSVKVEPWEYADTFTCGGCETKVTVGATRCHHCGLIFSIAETEKLPEK